MSLLLEMCENQSKFECQPIRKQYFEIVVDLSQCPTEELNKRSKISMNYIKNLINCRPAACNPKIFQENIFQKMLSKF